ncbi:unnamed protein product, partial [Ilex paraguariensis]
GTTIVGEIVPGNKKSKGESTSKEKNKGKIEQQNLNAGKQIKEVQQGKGENHKCFKPDNE